MTLADPAADLGEHRRGRPAARARRARAGSRRSGTRTSSRPGSSRTRARGRACGRPARSRSRRHPPRRQQRRFLPSAARRRRSRAARVKRTFEIRGAAGHVDTPRASARRARRPAATSTTASFVTQHVLMTATSAPVAALGGGRLRAAARGSPARPRTRPCSRGIVVVKRGHRRFKSLDALRRRRSRLRLPSAAFDACRSGRPPSRRASPSHARRQPGCAGTSPSR